MEFSSHSSLEFRTYSDVDKAKYRALADTTSKLLSNMGTPHFASSPIHCDNRSAIQVAHNDVCHEHTKHIKIDCHFIWHLLTKSTLHLRSISS